MSSSVETFPSLHCVSETAADRNAISAFRAFETQLRTLCLDEFPGGLGSWRCDVGLPTNRAELQALKSARLLQKFSITDRDYGAQHEMTETLTELATSRYSPWKVNYDWSDEAKSLRELAIKSPWIINDEFVWNHFRSLRIVDKGMWYMPYNDSGVRGALAVVTGVDEKLLLFRYLESLTLTANFIKRVDSRCLPRALKILELCANEIDILDDLCWCPPPLVHLGLGYNRLASLGQFFVGPCWPELRSLDLSHNDLTDLWSLINTLQSLLKLRNLVLVGNPFTLVPGYRGYTIDRLKKLDYLDDIGVSVDEKHYFRGIAKMTECNISDAKIRLTVPLLKGVLPPQEIANPDDLPEFPKIATRYMVQFMFFKDTCYEYDGESESLVESSSHVSAVASTQSRTKPSERSRLKLTEQPVPAMAKPIDPPPTCTSPAGLPLVGVRTLTSEWLQEMPMNWAKTLIIGDLRQLRDFCKEGVQVSVVEEKVLSSPLVEEKEEIPTSASKVGVDKGKSKEKDAQTKGKPKPDAKAGKPKDGKKKKGEPEVVVPLVAEPPVYTTLASFHIPLDKYLEGDFGVVSSTFVHEHPQPIKPPEPEVQMQDKKDKDKKQGDKKNAKGPGGKDKDKKGKGRPPGAGDDDGVILPMEVHVTIKLCHWKTTADVTKSIDDL